MSDELINSLRNHDRFKLNDLIVVMHNHPFTGPLMAAATEAADRIEALEEALRLIANEKVTHTKLNQQRLCCKFQDIAQKVLEN